MFAAAVVADLERETFASDRRLISGRTGATSWRPPLHTRPAGGAIDGRAELLISSYRGTTVLDGRTGAVRWTVAAPRPEMEW